MFALAEFNLSDFRGSLLLLAACWLLLLLFVPVTIECKAAKVPIGCMLKGEPVNVVAKKKSRQVGSS